MQDATPPPKRPSADLLLNKLPPDQRAQVIRAAAVLLVSRAKMFSTPNTLTPEELKRLRQNGNEPIANAQEAFLSKTLSPAELESLRARLRPEDQDRLRPDGLLEPALPPWTLCGGLESPYLIAPISPDSVSLPTSSAPDQPPLSAA